MKPKFFFFPMLVLAVSIAAITASAGAAELKAGLSVSGTWYELYLGQTHYDGPNATLTIIEVNGDVARVLYSFGEAPKWNINKSGSFELVAPVTREENITKIEFMGRRSGNKFTFIFDPADPLIKGRCRTPKGRIVSIELK